MARIPRWLVVMVALVLVVGMLATAQAQPPDRGPGRPGGGFRVGITQLLQNEAVQKELKLGEEQINQLKDIRDEMRKSEGRPTPEKLAEIEKQVKDILEPEQLKRLEEIRLQFDLRMQGVRALSEGDLAEKLGITDEQKEKLNKIGEESRAKIGEAFPRPEGGDRPQLTDEQRAARMTKMQELRKEAYEQAIKVLTPEQKEKLDGMTGKEFKIDMQGMMGGMRGPGQGRGERGRDRQPGQDLPHSSSSPRIRRPVIIDARDDSRVVSGFLAGSGCRRRLTRAVGEESRLRVLGQRFTSNRGEPGDRAQANYRGLDPSSRLRAAQNAGHTH